MSNGLTLPFQGTVSTPGPGFEVINTAGDCIVGLCTSNAAAGVSATNDSGGFGVWARGTPGGHFESNGGDGVGVHGTSGGLTGLAPNSPTGVLGESSGGFGLVGLTQTGYGVVGYSNGQEMSPAPTERPPFTFVGVLAECNSDWIGTAPLGFLSHLGVYADAGKKGTGIYARGGLPFQVGYSDGVAGFFDGDVVVTGQVSKGGGGFQIDHPLDPANKFLNHSFVESSERKNVYDGTSTLDSKGEAVVELPVWFEAVNRDFRYQLTAIGVAAPNLHIGKTISQNRFTIAGGAAGMQVSWQVTGARCDPWAQASPLVVEQGKAAVFQGRYLHPKLHNQPAENGIAAGTPVFKSSRPAP